MSVLAFPEIWEWLLLFEMLLATLIVFRVLFGYMHFFLKQA